MIPEWFMGLGVGIAEWFLSLFGTGEPPEFLSQLSTWLGGLISAASGFGAWVPWAFALTVATIVVSLWLLGFVVKGVRWLIGLIPTMGGG